jgi:hypothetical protein
MSDLTELKSWREGRHVSRADIDITIAGVADRIAELEAALREIRDMDRVVVWQCTSECYQTGQHTKACRPIDRVGDIAHRVLGDDDK